MASARMIPPQVENLASCEKEVAIIIYLHGPMTVKTLEDHLTRDLSNSAIRSMLFRLCAKKILKRRKITGSHLVTDRRVPYLYSPAITSGALRSRALIEVAREYFEGSLPRMAEELEALCLGRRPAAGRAPRRSESSGGARIAA